MPGRSRRGKRDGNRTLAALPKLRATLASHAANFCALPPPGFAGLRMCGLRVPDRRRRRFGIEAGLRLSRRPKRRPSKMKMEGRGSSWSLAASPLKTQDASGSVDRVVRETSSLDPHTSKSDCRFGKCRASVAAVLPRGKSKRRRNSSGAAGNASFWTMPPRRFVVSACAADNKKIAPHCQAGALVAVQSVPPARGVRHASSAALSDSRPRRLIFQVLSIVMPFFWAANKLF
jgi:hypothetical protein